MKSVQDSHFPDLKIKACRCASPNLPQLQLFKKRKWNARIQKKQIGETNLTREETRDRFEALANLCGIFTKSSSMTECDNSETEKFPQYFENS